MNRTIRHHGNITLSGNKKQVKNQIAKVLKSGGVMSLRSVEFEGQKGTLLGSFDPFHTKEMRSCFSYFDEAQGMLRFDPKTNRLEAKSTSGILNKTIGAAALLCDLSSQTYAFSELVGVDSAEALGWLNYLFKIELKPLYRNDLWRMAETILAEDERIIKEPTEIIPLSRLLNLLPAKAQFPVDHCLDALAVSMGIDALANRLEAERFSDSAVLNNLSYANLSALFTIKRILRIILNNQNGDQEAILAKTIDFLAMEDHERKIRREETAFLGLIGFYLNASSPVFILKALAEEFNRDFWQLYTVYRSKLAVNHRCPRPQGTVEPIKTEDYLNLTEAEQIFFFPKEYVFSDALARRFERLRRRAEQLLKQPLFCTDRKDFLRRLHVLMRMLEDDYDLYLFETTYDEFSDLWQSIGIQTLFELLRQTVQENREEARNYPAVKNRKSAENARRYNPARSEVKALIALLANRSLRYRTLGI